MHDPRLTPMRGDLAAKYLEGKVQADRFVTGEEYEIVEAIAPVRQQPSSNAMLMTQSATRRTRHGLRSRRRRLGLGSAFR
ncbi:hypothetical protein ACVWWR_004074 [Bradyrhizobium sp. LM3.2]